MNAIEGYLRAYQNKFKFYNPNMYQIQIHNDKHKYRVINSPRRAGKTTYIVNEAINNMFNNKSTLIVCANYHQRKFIFDKILSVIRKSDYLNEEDYYYRDGQLICHIGHQSHIEIKTCTDLLGQTFYQHETIYIDDYDLLDNISLYIPMMMNNRDKIKRIELLGTKHEYEPDFVHMFHRLNLK